jgi:hypothetical protein
LSKSASRLVPGGGAAGTPVGQLEAKDFASRWQDAFKDAIDSKGQINKQKLPALKANLLQFVQEGDTFSKWGDRLTAAKSVFGIQDPADVLAILKFGAVHFGLPTVIHEGMAGGLLRSDMDAAFTPDIVDQVLGPAPAVPVAPKVPKEMNMDELVKSSIQSQDEEQIRELAKRLGTSFRSLKKVMQSAALKGGE